MHTLENTSHKELLFGYGLLCACVAHPFSASMFVAPQYYDGTGAIDSRAFVAIDDAGKICLTKRLPYTPVGYDNQFKVPKNWKIVAQVYDVVKESVGLGVPISVNLHKTINGDPIEDNDFYAKEWKISKALRILDEIDDQRSRKSLTGKQFIDFYFNVVKPTAQENFGNQKAAPSILKVGAYSVDTRPFFGNPQKYKQTAEEFAEYVFYYATAEREFGRCIMERFETEGAVE